VHVRIGACLFALDDYPVKITAALLGELKGVPGIGVALATYPGGRGSGDRRARLAG
jgi:DNA polymerase III subunit alpha